MVKERTVILGTEMRAQAMLAAAFQCLPLGGGQPSLYFSSECRGLAVKKNQKP